MTREELLKRLVDPDHLLQDAIAVFMWTIVFGRLPKPFTIKLSAYRSEK